MRRVRHDAHPGGGRPGDATTGRRRWSSAFPMRGSAWAAPSRWSSGRAANGRPRTRPRRRRSLRLQHTLLNHGPRYRAGTQPSSPLSPRTRAQSAPRRSSTVTQSPSMKPRGVQSSSRGEARSTTPWPSVRATSRRSLACPLGVGDGEPGMRPAAAGLVAATVAWLPATTRVACLVALTPSTSVLGRVSPPEKITRAASIAATSSPPRRVLPNAIRSVGRES